MDVIRLRGGEDEQVVAADAEEEDGPGEQEVGRTGAQLRDQLCLGGLEVLHLLRQWDVVARVSGVEDPSSSGSIADTAATSCEDQTAGARCQRQVWRRTRREPHALCEVVSDVVAIAESSSGNGAREVDTVVGLVGLGHARPRQVVVVAHIQRGVPEHKHRRRSATCSCRSSDDGRRLQGR